MTGHDAQQSEPANDPSQPQIPLAKAAIIGLSAVAMIVVAQAHWDNPVLAVGLAVMLAVCGWLSAIDYEVHRLPNRIVGPLAAAVAVAVVGGGLWSEDLARSGRALLFGLAAAAFLLLGNLIGGLGMGDVKYAFPLATALGWFGVGPVILWALVTAAIGGVAGLAVILFGQGRGHRIPYGPFMTVGLFVGLLSAAPAL